MRKIVLDTEPTGLDPKQGHRIIELAAIELEGRKVSLRRFHRYTTCYILVRHFRIHAGRKERMDNMHFQQPVRCIRCPGHSKQCRLLPSQGLASTPRGP